MKRLAWWLGALIQGLIVAGGLAVALLKLMELGSNVQIFRYQGF